MIIRIGSKNWDLAAIEKSPTYNELSILIQAEILNEIREIRRQFRLNLNCIQEQTTKMWKQIQYLRKELKELGISRKNSRKKT